MILFNLGFFSLLICQLRAQNLDPHNIFRNYIVELNMVVTTLRRTLRTESVCFVAIRLAFFGLLATVSMSIGFRAHSGVFRLEDCVATCNTELAASTRYLLTGRGASCLHLITGQYFLKCLKKN